MSRSRTWRGAGGRCATGPLARAVALPVTLLALSLGACARVGTVPAPDPAPRAGPIGRPIPEGPTGGAAAPAEGAPGAAVSGEVRPARRFEEVRGLWVVRTSMTHPDSVRAMVDRAADAGFNTLLVQVRGRGDAVHPSAIEPRFDGLAPAPAAFDPLALAIERAHARGVAVHAWVNVNLVTGMRRPPDDPRHLARAHPEALMVPRALARELARMSPHDPRYLERLLEWARAHDDRVEGVYASPRSAAVRERVEAVVVDLIERYDVDGIHLDYVRYPHPEFDYSAGAVTAFREWAAPRLDPGERRALDRAAEADPLAWPDGQPRLWGDFRREQVTRLVERLHFAVKTRRPEVALSAAVRPDTVDARRDRLQDWPAWARSGILDVVVPMAYAPDDARFHEQVSQAVGALPSTGVWAGIGTYLTGLDGTLRKLRIARGLGTGGFVLFSYDWAVSPAGGGGTAFLERVGRELGPAPPCLLACAR